MLRSRRHLEHGFPRVTARLSAHALKNNFQVIQDQVPDQSILPMLKANAYGHDAVWAAKTLSHQHQLYGFGFATLEEAAEVREALGKRGRLLVFSGAAPWTEEKGQFCEKHHLTPVIATDPDWHAFLKGGWPSRIPYEIKFNTGMNRLGLSLGLAGALARALASRPAVEHPSGVLTHLAMGEAPEAQLSRTQRDKFRWLRSEFEASFPSTHFHFANSGAIWTQKQWGLQGTTDAVRPGLALYGIPPWKGAPMRGLQPVMTLEALVLGVHRLKPGESMGYGAAFQVRGKSPVHAAVLGAGYADGLSRLLADRGQVRIGGKPSRYLGRISMDLSAVETDGSIEPGDWAQLLGSGIDPWEQAEAAQTIPYELLTSVSSRVQRVYG